MRYPALAFAHTSDLVPPPAPELPLPLPPSGKVDSSELHKVLVSCGRMKMTEEEAQEFIGQSLAPAPSPAPASDREGT